MDNARTRRGFSIPKILARAEAVGAWDDCAATVDGDGRDALFWLCKNASGPELLACAEPLLAHGSDPARMDRVGTISDIYRNG